MSAQTELLWPGAALLLLLGVAAGLCVRCSRPGAKKSEKIYEQRSLQENQQSFSVARTYSLVRQSRPAALVDTASDVAPRKDKLLRFSPSTKDPASPRYQNFSNGSRHGSDAVYIDPITMDYYNWGQFQKPLEDDDDASSYENVFLCRQKRPESGDEGSKDYENLASIQQRQESRKVLEQVPREAPRSRAGSSDEDGEPDYVNEEGAKGTPERVGLFIASLTASEEGALHQSRSTSRPRHRRSWEVHQPVPTSAHLVPGKDSYMWNRLQTRLLRGLAPRVAGPLP